MRIYVASSWRNVHQPVVVSALRSAGHEVYDFRHPEPGNDGFSWAQIDPAWQTWTPQQYREALKHPIAGVGYALDMTALMTCDACVLVLPSGRSASWEFGFACGKKKRGVVYMPESCAPELMYLGKEIVVDLDELLRACSSNASPAQLEACRHGIHSIVATEDVGVCRFCGEAVVQRET